MPSAVQPFRKNKNIKLTCVYLSRVKLRERKICTGLLLLANILCVFQSTGVENHQYQYHQYPPPPGSPLQLTPTLLLSQVDRLADTAYHLVRDLPPLEPKTQQLNNKRKMSKELEVGGASKVGRVRLFTGGGLASPPHHRHPPAQGGTSPPGSTFRSLERG